MTTESITITRPVYTVTVVCPLCHEVITWKHDGVATCEHCGAQFVLKTAPKVGPSETKKNDSSKV